VGVDPLGRVSLYITTTYKKMQCLSPIGVHACSAKNNSFFILVCFLTFSARESRWFVISF